MLHLAMLAHHRLWEDYFKGLKYVIIDEVHTYRGVMSSNMAWVFRRLQRICRLYGSQPVFIFCSATIVYTQSRKITELIAIWASRKARGFSHKISAYRAGFLPETAMINPDNPVTIKQHLECAAAELSLVRKERFLDDPGVQTTVKALEYSGKLLRTLQGDLWFAARKSPHRDVSLRGTGNSLPIFLEQTKQNIGDIDRHRSFFETHEGAVYLHRGKTYVISRFDHEQGIIEARREDVVYFTKARSSKHTTIIEHKKSTWINGTRVGFGAQPRRWVDGTRLNKWGSVWPFGTIQAPGNTMNIFRMILNNWFWI